MASVHHLLLWLAVSTCTSPSGFKGLFCVFTHESTLLWMQVVKVGGLIATINVDLKSTRTGELIAQGKHIKFLSSKDKGIPKAPSPQAMRAKL